MTRTELEEFLKDIGPPGEKQEEKIEAVKALNLKANTQGHGVESTLDGYANF